MRRSVLSPSALALLAAALCGPPSLHAADHEIGVGIHYWTALDDLDDVGFDVDEDGSAWFLAYQIDPVGLFAFELDVAYYEDGFGGSPEEAIVPQAFVLLGGFVYGGVGVGYIAADDLEGDDTFFAARAGVDFTVLPRLHLDVNLNYQADSFDGLGDASSDSITLGAMARFRIR